MPGRRLVLVALCIFAATSGPPLHAQETQADPRSARIDIAAHVREAAQRFGIPEDWIYAVIRTESAGHIGAVSSAGAMGLMQLMPGTWARQRSRFRLGPDPFDPRDNIMAGTSYLREMYDSYGEDGFLAAYNAGPGRYEQWRDDGRPLPAETRRYVDRIAALLRPARIFIAATSSTVGRTEWSIFAPSKASGSDHQRQESDGAILNFEREAEPAHDLFVPVSTPRDR